MPLVDATMLSVPQTTPSGPGVIGPVNPINAGFPDSVKSPDVVYRTISLGVVTNHNASSGPVVMNRGNEKVATDSVIVPSVVIRPILPDVSSVNQRASSAPEVIQARPLDDVGTGYSVTIPKVEMRPMLLPEYSVNQSAPSGPLVIAPSELEAVGTAYSVRAPAGVIRPILLAVASVNQSAPSGPATIEFGPLPAVGIVYSVNVGGACVQPRTAQTWIPTNSRTARIDRRGPPNSLANVVNSFEFYHPSQFEK
jgi:hypothetical protein